MEEPAQEDNGYTVHYGILRVETIEQEKTAIIHEIEKTHTHIHSVENQRKHTHWQPGNAVFLQHKIS